MWPLLAVGAAVLGGFTIATMSSQSNEPGSDKKRHTSDPADAARPQNYLLVPISSDGQNRPQTLTATEAVKKLIF